MMHKPEVSSPPMLPSAQTLLGLSMEDLTPPLDTPFRCLGVSKPGCLRSHESNWSWAVQIPRSEAAIQPRRTLRCGALWTERRTELRDARKNPKDLNLVCLLKGFPYFTLGLLIDLNLTIAYCMCPQQRCGVQKTGSTLRIGHLCLKTWRKLLCVDLVFVGGHAIFLLLRRRRQIVNEHR